MPRHLSHAVAIAAALLVLLVIAPVATARQDAQRLTVTSPRHAVPGRLSAVTVRLSLNVAAVDGRVLVTSGAAQLIGVAPAGRGSALRPEEVAGGYAFAAYDLHPAHGQNLVQLVFDPQVRGAVEVRILVDSVADAAGRRLSAPPAALAVLGAAADGRVIAAPDAGSVPNFARPGQAHPVRRLAGPGGLSAEDLDIARAAWTSTREAGAACGTSAPDANGDGCVDAVDLQSVVAALRAAHKPLSVAGASQPIASPGPLPPGHTFTVTSTLDTADAAVGDGTCADNRGRCTLRAAIQEADWDQGNDRISFHIPGSGVPVIQLSSGLPLITSLRGTLTIDGYTQPGARVNSATILTNGRPGVEVRGNGENADEALFYITSGGNTIRGLILSDFYRGIMIDGKNAVGNRVIGNWIGFETNGTNTINQFGVLVNTGAKHNLIGTPALADRNIIGNGKDAVNNYGPGTNGNITQNNVFCINPYGGDATCTIGEDHNFGPKFGLIGGYGPNERNVIGRTLFQAVEYSHGWNRSLPWGTDHKTTWQINGNRLIGNWLGFKADGSYKKSWRSGQIGQYYDGEAVNVFDGSNRTLVEGNWMSSVLDGVSLAAPNTSGNIIRDNHIGISPRGEAAPMPGWGVRIRWQASSQVVIGNTISYAARGGIGIENQCFSERLSRNLVTHTSGPAIYLASDPKHPQKGANHLVAAPVITQASKSLIRGTAIAGSTVEVYLADRSAGESGLPIRYLGTTTADSSGAWQLTPRRVAKGDPVTALQIRPDQDTSELARNVIVAKG